MTKQRTNVSTGLWSRTTRALGKLLAGMVSLPDDRRQTSRWNDFPTFPPY
jgi:hypothetical protein